ncbi:MAG TPA: phosphoserine phosphatase [Thermoplasmata archaeon]|nr:phosphoserine phosphatase [Thermoplasmata archaeon]
MPDGPHLPDAIEELERKRAESNVRADDHRAQRDRLNSEARQLAEKRAMVLDELHAKSAEAQDHRHHRDELNENVRDAKRLREEWNRKLQESSDRVQELKRTRGPRPGAVPVWRLRKELKELEFRHMTSALTPDQEKRLVAEMQRLELAIRDQDEQFRKDPEIDSAITAMNEARVEAEKHHAAVGQLAEEAQRAHEAMVGLYVAVDELRRQADEVQAKLIEVKGNADEQHRAHIAAIEEVRDIEKMLYAARGGRAPPSFGEAEPPKEEDFLARLKKGEKVSTEDLLELQKSGRA